MNKIIVFIFLLTSCLSAFAQTFIYGNDLSYTNQMEDCGAVYKENSQAKDVYQIFADHGSNLVRVRMWHNPTWQNSIVQPAGVKNQYSDYADVKETIIRAKGAGMQVMIDIHLSDFWCDAKYQVIPFAWKNVAYSNTVLADSVYNYVSKVLIDLNQDGVMPEFVKIGNENNGGILRYTTLNGDLTQSGLVSSDWSRHAVLFNAAIKAVRDVSASTTIKPKIALHYAGIKSVLSYFTNNIVANGITDFDIIGFSYYYAWHGYSIAEMGNTIRSLKSRFPQYEVMAVETGYLWSTQNFDGNPNIITTPDPAYLPVCPAKQLEYMTDYAREVKRAGGSGVIFWEPSWVSTPCSTAWGKGSSHDHVAFFDPVTTNFMQNGGGRWGESQFYTNVNDKKATFKVDMAGQDVSNGVFISGSWAAGQYFPMADLGNGIYSYYIYLPQNSSGSYFFANGNDVSKRETVPAACALINGSDRQYALATSDVKFAFKFGSCDAANEASPYVTFKVDMTGQDVSKGVYIVGDFNAWAFQPLTNTGDNIYTWTTQIAASTTMKAYYYIRNNNWNTGWQAYRETVPTACAPMWGTDRGIVIEKRDTVVNNVFSSCAQYITSAKPDKFDMMQMLTIAPNPCNGQFAINFNKQVNDVKVEAFDYQGMALNADLSQSASSINVKFSQNIKGLILVRITVDGNVYNEKIIVR